MDDTEGVKDKYIWNIYYHLYLDNTSLELVQTQSKKLHALSPSIHSWHDSKYGKLLRICDEDTLTKVRETWKSYSSSNLSEIKKEIYDERFRLGIQRARDLQADLLGPDLVYSLAGFRSAAPVGLQSIKDFHDLHQRFWDHGITDQDRGGVPETRHPNPMFAPMLTDTFILHYGTDPLLGFHLATAYVPLTSGSPLHLKPSKRSHLHKVVEAARLQFKVWGEAFRRCARQRLTLRFFAGEALAFCHTLQHRQLTGHAISANWYRGQYNLQQLVLNGGDYAAAGDAPLSFKVIDTSNLMDHVGAINILVATSPLLDRDLSATLYTESLAKREQDQKALVDGLLCGHFPTISTLFGLFPIEYWTNATAISSVDETLLDVAHVMAGTKDDNKGQMYSRLAWKRQISGSSRPPQPTTLSPLHFTEIELAQVLYKAYLKMFQHEDMSVLFSKVDLLTIQNNSCPRYHRGSLAAFLAFVKKRVVVDWNRLMEALLNLIESDSSIAMGLNNIQELYVQLHLLGVYSVAKLRAPVNNSKAQAFNSLRAWNHIPEVICITLKVPRARLGVFTRVPLGQIGTPPLHCILRSSRTYAGRAWHNIFAVVQLAFGDATPSGLRSDDGFKIKVVQDRHGWGGNSPMLVSFCAPTWLILQLEPGAISVALGVQTTPHSTMTFVKALGLEMNVYETNLGNEDNVYITKHRPNQSAHASICSFADVNDVSHGCPGEADRTTIKANVDLKTAQIATLTGRIDLLSEYVKSLLRSGADVETIQISPCIIAVIIGKSPRQYQHHLHFPAPVLRSRSISRIARKSSYVEVVSPVCGPMDEERFPHFMYPLYLDARQPVIWNMPRLNLECLPILDMAKPKDLEWLVTHTSLMFSSRERTLKDRSMVPGAKTHNDVRTNFKDSLFSMFMQFSGLQGRRSRFFGIHNPTAGGLHVLVFVSCLRLDMANHTVVLDTAILPLTDQLVPDIHSFLAALSGLVICQISVDDEELRLWKQVIPALVERCRLWPHHPTSCEYLKQCRIPLSLENGHTPICSCGDGTLPPKFVSGVPLWDTVSRYAVRAAISPSFSLPFVEPVYADVHGSTAPPGATKSTNTVPGTVHGTTAITTAANRSKDLCTTCGPEKSTPGMKLLSCARCHAVKYCSVECQRADWKEHKKVCAK